MPKAEKGSVKDIANRMKARGLQKLRFYCQMCQKQCRDANGFKCHIQSDSHMRQMKIFSENAGGFLEQYSKEFEQSFMTNLRMRHGTKKVNANNVYQEVISDKQHIHMNATHWTTLTEFVQYLGKTGKCIVEENHSDGTGGWYISYIERDSGILARREAQKQREAADQKAEAALLERMKAQRIAAARALDRAGGSVTVQATSIQQNGNTAPAIKLGLGAAKMKTAKKKSTASIGTSAFGDDDDEENNDDEKDYSKRKSANTNVEKMMKETTMRKQAAATTMNENKNSSSKDSSANPKTTKKRKLNDDGNRRIEEITKRSRDERSEVSRTKPSEEQQAVKDQNSWLYRDIMVRVVSKRLAGGKYFRKKAVVDTIVGDGFAAEVEVLGDSEDGVDGDILRLDQDDLETVIPKVSSGGKPKKVRILRGEFRGEKATIEHLDKSKYRADLILYKPKRDEDRGRRLRKVPYEDFSQIA
ncbi:unnamed protein product [Pseudo-nitzschia multistriata]|uniref:C2H2-type domain-containing protein n=1 Tax=Pseudo-nitzschia multistriata TaxID=183589 RepID=A0A448ZF51_9STRA|nr:unnamed protein product [Pseudo-nitzschia multistriata]